MDEVQKSALEEEQALWEQESDTATAEEPKPEAEPAIEAKPEEPAVEAATEATTEPAVEPVAEPVKEPVEKESKVVPLAALLEERDKRQKAEQELAVQRARDEERAARQQPSPQQQKTEEQQLQDSIAQEIVKEIGNRPNDQDDPIATAEWEDRFKAKFELKHTQHMARRAEETAQALSLRNELQTDRMAFEKATPDYGEALDWLVEEQKQFYIMTGASEQEAMWLTNRDAGMLIEGARKRRESPANLIYQMAKRRGFQSKAAAPVPAPVAEAPKPPTAEEKLDTIKEGQKIVSLSRSAGAGNPSEVTEAQIDSMSTQELHKWLENPKNAARYHKMLGLEE